jgi:hypothetical protein
MAGEPEGDADMRSSSPPLPSSSALRLRLDMEDERTAEGEALARLYGRRRTVVQVPADSLLRVGDRRLGSRCGGGVKLLLMTFIAVADGGVGGQVPEQLARGGFTVRGEE